MSSPTITLGRVDEHEGERVETDFRTLLGVLPLTPVASYYRRSEDQRYPIALNTKSVLKATLSYHALYLTIGIFALAVLNIQDPIGELLLFSGVVSALVCAFARFRLGKLTPAQERQRSIHVAVTGVSALPSMLPAELVKTLRDALERKWSKRAGKKSSWRDVLDADQASPDDLQLLAVLAAYDACIELDASASARAKAAWAALGDHDHLPLESLSPEEAQRALQAVSDAPATPAPRVAKRKTSTKKRKRRSSRGIKIRCERCEHVTRVPDTCAGQTGRCPSCERGVRVPSLESMRLLRAA